MRAARPALLGPFLFSLVALLLGVAVHGAWTFLAALAAEPEWIDVNTGAAGALPAAVAIGLWAGILAGWRLTARAEGRAMRLSFLCVPLIVLLPPAVTPVVDHVLSERGYERCPAEIGRRFPGARYHRGAPGICP